MRYPNTGPKSELTLSAGHDVDRCVACSPDDFPPYPRIPPPPLRVRLRAAGAFGVILFILLLGSFQGVSASGQLPLPSPWPSGSTKPIVQPPCDVRHPCASISLIPIPDTDTVR